jgi:hypothetical protein
VSVANTSRAVEALTRAARTEHDFADWLAHALAAVAGQLGRTDALVEGRPGSWEADLVMQLVRGTVGYDDEYLPRAERPGEADRRPSPGDPGAVRLGRDDAARAGRRVWRLAGHDQRHHQRPDVAVAGMTGTVRRWPLALIAAPAAVSIWSGWVGLGGMCGFGVVHPLPGIVPQLRLDTAITLPVGVEAYGAYALGAWLSLAAAHPARKFARSSAIGSLLLGMLGQVAYHVLAAAHAHRAPWPIVVLVACLPVVTLGFGAALTHLLRASEPLPDTAREAAPGPVTVTRPSAPADSPERRTRARVGAAPGKRTPKCARDRDRRRTALRIRPGGRQPAEPRARPLPLPQGARAAAEAVLVARPRTVWQRQAPRRVPRRTPALTSLAASRHRSARVSAGQGRAER